MTRRLIIALTLLTVSTAATAYAVVTTIPPSEYPPGCHPNGAALQGHRGDQSVSGTPQRDLLRGGPSSNIITGYERRDCLFGQGGLDVVDGRGGDDWVRGGD